MTDNVRPFDWLSFGVECLVLIIICAEWLHSVRAASKEKRDRDERHRIVKEWRRDISIWLGKGRKLSYTVPSRVINAPNEKIQHNMEQSVEWNREVEGWVADCADFLRTYSPSAAIAFTEATKALPNDWYMNVSRHSEEQYRLLLNRLSNLKEIFNKSDIYL